MPVCSLRLLQAKGAMVMEWHRYGYVQDNEVMDQSHDQVMRELSVDRTMLMQLVPTIRPYEWGCSSETIRKVPR